jgi:hypothetical protein
MSHERVTATVTHWSGRFKAELYVDGFRVEKAYFATFQEAFEWAQARKAQKEEEMAL